MVVEPGGLWGDGGGFLVVCGRGGCPVVCGETLPGDGRRWWGRWCFRKPVVGAGGWWGRWCFRKPVIFVSSPVVSAEAEVTFLSPMMPR
ncbi:hypothetical protein HanRHA438_Chr02g0064731 [Helianthus annuus]|nr:hypothetical protein HanRHA438_Chr02g0064731 [Helianthus annuus]